MPTFGEILRTIRTEKHLKQTDIVVEGITSATISQYESNKRLPSFEILTALAKKLNVSVAVFFPDSNNEGYNQVFATLMNQAERHERRKQWEEALESWEAALLFCRSHHYTSYLFQILQHKGIVLAELNRNQEAIDTLLGLLIHPEFTHDRDESYQILSVLGKCARELGQTEQSITFAQLAASLVGPSDERWIRMQINLGSGFQNLGEWDRAIYYFENAVARSREIGHGLLEAWSLVGLISAYLSKEELDYVNEYFERARQLAELLQDLKLRRSIKHTEIVYYRLKKQWMHAKQTLFELLQSDELSDQVRAELLHEQLLIAAGSKDFRLGEEAQHAFEFLSVSSSMMGLFWLGAAEFYISFQNEERANEILRHAASFLKVSHYHDTKQLLQLASLLERRGSHA
ncbi:helix-turn-helix transcriptional regulator [Alicyclobacillus tolerans]|uniref:Transcriptional regulator, contains XRE-family HTH domain n=2 Tax=Alicyclobacillus tolerans TaxID=90970 RepID=A0A1M6SS01_9BACL|nr:MULTISPECIES: helix-turn-helix transcriptional regulator [Alicyclobacillus]MDP9727132.1 transcriptional regulator with XRE-family HTH domain [Alicyclobacillus tengchongensis]SHK47514.1 Transcriptional regulator, contains XRE-family HTH domain [Alicyclobacillus montanus]